jgi:hypothetical protein
LQIFNFLWSYILIDLNILFVLILLILLNKVSMKCIISIKIFMIINNIRILCWCAIYVFIWIFALKLLMRELILTFLNRIIVGLIKISKVIITRTCNSPRIYCWTYNWISTFYLITILIILSLLAVLILHLITLLFITYLYNFEFWGLQL